MEERLPAVRVARDSDRTEFERLWKVCFGDSDAFCDWFFANRFRAAYSAILETEGEAASCMQAFPYTVLIRGKEIPAAMLCGVSTDPKHRRKGFMGKLFSFEMQHLRRMGMVVAPHTPAVLPSYFAFGHFPVADASYLECDAVPKQTPTQALLPVGAGEWQKLLPLYQCFAARYSGIVWRSEADFLRKAADYAADGGQCAAYYEKGEAKGYAFYYRTAETLLCVEAVADAGYFHPLLAGLLALGEGLAFSAKLPPDLYLSFPCTRQTKRQKGVMGLCDAPALLRALELDISGCFLLRDAVIAEQNGCVDFRGNAAAGEPIFAISAGHLMQLLVGYRTAEELRDEIEIFDEAAFAMVHRLLPKQPCYIIDEY